MLSQIIAPSATKSKPRETRFPTCFEDHKAPRSVRALFVKWVNAADSTDNGVIMINRQQQPYSDTTVDRAICWLVNHKLLLRVERNTGRGNASRYFVRWSFKYPNLSTRQKAVNHAEPTKRVNFPTIVEEIQDRERFPRKTASAVHIGESQKKLHLRLKAPTPTESEIRWGLARARDFLREELDPADEGFDEERRWLLTAYMDALAVTIRRMARKVRSGPEFTLFINELLDLVGQSLERWELEKRAIFSLTGYLAREALSSVLEARRQREEELRRRREREEARRDPLPAVGFVRKLIEEARVSFANPAATGKDPVGYARLRAEREKVAESFEGIKSWRDFLKADEPSEKPGKFERRSIHRARRRACIQTGGGAEGT